MNNVVKKWGAQIVVGIIAVIHTCLSFITDKNIFVFPDKASSGYNAAVFDYVVCKLLTLAALFAIYSIIYSIIRKDRADHTPYQIAVSALPYIIVLLAVAAIKLPQGYLSNDEYAIYNDAVNLTHSTWFCYLTPYYYTVSLMILPFKYAPIIFKLIIEYGVVGYVTYRSKQYFGKRIGLISYVLFLLYPVIAYTTSAHRLPIYFLLYLCLFAKMLYDRLEHKGISAAGMAGMLLTGAVLTQWRTEGIYLAALVPILMLVVYYPYIICGKSQACGSDDDGVDAHNGGNDSDNADTHNADSDAAAEADSTNNETISRAGRIARLGMFIAASLIFQIIVSYPQNAFSSAALDDAANDRMKPFYAYTITNMYRNGLDLDKNREDLQIVDRYLSLEAIAAINEHYEDINYEDVLILYQDGFVGVREDATVQDFIDYSDALKRIFVNNPDVFLRTRVGAFGYSALPYHISYSGMGLKSLLSFGLSLVKSLSYNLFIPLIVVVVLLIYSLIRKRWFDFFVAGGLLCHWFIVFILAPASYFKYYFPLYIMAYFYILLGVMSFIKNRKLPESSRQR